MKNAILIVALILTVMCCAASGHAEEVEDGSGVNDLVIDITPYVWLASVNATSTVNGLKTDVNKTFDELVSELNLFSELMELGGRVEIWKGRFGFIFDGQYIVVHVGTSFSSSRRLRLLQRDIPTSFSADLKFSLETLNFLLTYRLLNLNLSDDSVMALKFQPMVGLRYNELQQEVDVMLSVGRFSRERTIGDTAYWWEPVVGGQLVFTATEWLDLFGSFDFGINAADASDVSWTALTTANFHLSDWASVKLGWKWYGLDYSHGEGVEKFGFSGVLNGPWVGFGFTY